MRELDLLAVKGKTIPMAVYELMAEGTANGDVKARIDQYASGLAHYRAQRWDDAEAAWTRLLKEFPNDGPAAKMLLRVAKLRHEALPPDWDGVYRSKEK
jgi:adenylate cyclase